MPNTTMPIALPSPQLLEIIGPDAIAFVHAQFSSDVLALANGHWQWSAWLSAQGRVRAFFHLLRLGDGHLRLVLRGGSAPEFRDALARYVLRAKVQLRVPTDTLAYIVEKQTDDPDIAALPTASAIRSKARNTVIALPGKPARWLLLRDADADRLVVENSAASLNRNALADIDAGVVTLDTTLQDRLLPNWIGLDDLGATSVRKGCYPGQEIVARLHFKGGNKRWLHRIEFDAIGLPPPGTALNATEAAQADELGTIVCSAWMEEGKGVALAVLRDSDGTAPLSLSVQDSIVRSAKRAAAPVKTAQ